MRTRFKYNQKWAFIYLFFFAIILIFNFYIHNDWPLYHPAFLKFLTREQLRNFFSCFLIPFISPITFWVLSQISRENDEIHKSIERKDNSEKKSNKS